MMATGAIIRESIADDTKCLTNQTALALMMCFEPGASGAPGLLPVVDNGDRAMVAMSSSQDFTRILSDYDV